MEGLKESDSPEVDTINDARIGMMESLPQRFEPSELSQLTAVPVPTPTAEIRLRPDKDSLADTTQSTDGKQQRVVPASPLPTAVAVAELSDAEGIREIDDDPVIAPDPVEKLSEFPILTSPAGELTLADYQQIPELEVAPAVTITQRQKRMLDRKIKKWAEKIDISEGSPESVSWKHKGQTYVAKFSRFPASNEMDMDQIVVEVTTQQDGRQLTTVMRMKQLAFSNFAQFIHRWDPGVMIHDDEMDGRFHSNSQISLDFDRHTKPVFHDKVTTASFRLFFDRVARKSTRKQIFRGGLETGIKKIRMPKPRLLFADLQAPSGQNKQLFTEDTRIIFKQDGQYTWQSLDDDTLIQQQLIGDEPVYLLAAPGITLHVSGTVKGKVMVYSPRRIVIEDDLVYNAGGLAGGDDVLGLVSDHDIVIAKQEITGEGDLTINASIYAKHRFAVRDYSTDRTGTLNIVGSVSAGTVTATEPRYATRIVFDKRFETLRPPGFPVTDSYELTNLDYDWLVAPQESTENN